EDGEVVHGEGRFVGYRHHDAVEGDVSYPFGHGLSYTTFEYTDLEATALDARDDTGGWRGPPRVRVSLRVTNTGTVAGREVVQVYVADLDAPRPRTVRELRAFTKVALEPGSSEEVTFVLTERDLSRWSARADGWLFEPGP